ERRGIREVVSGVREQREAATRPPGDRFNADECHGDCDGGTHRPRVGYETASEGVRFTCSRCVAAGDDWPRVKAVPAWAANTPNLSRTTGDIRHLPLPKRRGRGARSRRAGHVCVADISDNP